MTNYAKDSTIDINPDRWGNLVVDVNGEGVVVMPKPYAIDATGKRFEMNFGLDKNAQTIAVTGDLTGAEYPITIDPTERVTNGGFEAGSISGWTSFGSPTQLSIVSGGAYQGTYYLDYIGRSSTYTGLSQTIDYTGVNSVSAAAAIPVYNRYDFVVSEVQITRGNYYFNLPGQIVSGWTPQSATPTLSGTSTIKLWTYHTNHGHIDSISAIVPDAPVADFTGTPTSGYKPLTVKFTDLSTNSPTSWSWDFGDGDSTNATVQNPIHTYTSAGTYTVELTATNSGGSDAEEKAGYISVNNPPSNQATDIQGRNAAGGIDLYQDVTVYAKNDQITYGYDESQAYHKPPYTTLNQRLPDDNIFFFNGHSLPGRIQINEDTDEYFCANGCNAGHNYNELTTPFMKFAQFQSCDSGDTDLTYGNLVQVAENRGADCAFGFDNTLYRYDAAVAYAQEFWDEIADGQTPSYSHAQAVSVVQTVENCDIYDDYACGYSYLYSQGDGCHVALTPPYSLLSESAEQKQLSKEEKTLVYNAIQKFTQNAQMISSGTEMKTITTNLYKISSPNSTYYVNTNTGRVQSALFYEDIPDQLGKKVNLDEARIIADRYVREKFPELWEISDKKEVKLIQEQENNRGEEGIEYRFIWREILNPSNTTTHQPFAINGPNGVMVTISPYSGKVISYVEHKEPIDSDLNLQPTVTESQAWGGARGYYEKEGVTNILPSELSQKGLWIIRDDSGKQHLVWVFDVIKREKWTVGGTVYVDAHNGDVIEYGEVL